MLKSKLFFVVFLSLLISSCSSEETLTPEQENQKIEVQVVPPFSVFQTPPEAEPA